MKVSRLQLTAVVATAAVADAAVFPRRIKDVQANTIMAPPETSALTPDWQTSERGKQHALLLSTV